MTEALETRVEYQKRLREERKKQRRKTVKKGVLIALALVITAGVLCGTVIANNVSTPHGAVEIASANAQYIKDKLQDAAKDVKDELSFALYKVSQHNPFADNGNPSAPVVPTEDDREEQPGTEMEAEKENQNDVEDNSENITSSDVVVPDNPYGIDPTKPMVALTFDDGPSKYTWPIVTTLYQHNARATFFLVGDRVATHKAAIEFILANHNEVASHSFSHANLVNCTDEELQAQIEKTDTVLQKQHNYIPALLRVPYGERDERVLEAMRQHNKPVIGWAVDPRDWEVQDKDEIVKHVLRYVKDGDIILMHDLYQPTADAVAELVPALQEKGYQLVTVSELLHYKGIEPVPGTYYYASWKWV